MHTHTRTQTYTYTHTKREHFGRVIKLPHPCTLDSRHKLLIKDKQNTLKRTMRAVLTHWAGEQDCKEVGWGRVWLSKRQGKLWKLKRKYLIINRPKWKAEKSLPVEKQQPQTERQKEGELGKRVRVRAREKERERERGARREIMLFIIPLTAL